MNDPERLLDRPSSLDARLLSAIDEPAPPDLLARTLASVGAASVVPAAIASSAASSGAKVVAAKVAMGGILSAVAAGVLAGAVVVGVVVSGGFSVPLGETPKPPPVSLGETPKPPIAEVSPAPSSVVVAPPVVVSSAEAPPAPAPSMAAPRVPVSAGSPAGVPRASVATSLATEIELLDEARRALDGGDAARAKLVMDRYAREAPHGQLAREAALLRAEIARANAPTNR